jgi:hypothetical protein
LSISLALVSLLRLCGRGRDVTRGGEEGDYGCLYNFLHRYFKDSAQMPNLHVSISKLTLKPKEGPGLLDPTKDPLKWQRLKVRIMVG